jgi:ATP-binding cassette subfamily F protein uup
VAKPLTYAERIELEGIVDRVGDAEARVTQLEAALADPALYARDGEAQKKARADYEAARDEATRLMARWEALEARRGEKA